MTNPIENLFAKAMPLLFFALVVGGVFGLINFFHDKENTDVLWQSIGALLFGLYGFRLVYSPSKGLRGIVQTVRISLLASGVICLIYGIPMLLFGFNTTAGDVPRSEAIQAIVIGAILLMIGGGSSLLMHAVQGRIQNRKSNQRPHSIADSAGSE